MQVTIRHIFVSPGHNFVGRFGQEPLDHEARDLDEIECVAGKGLAGDRYFDHEENYKGQATFFSWEVFQEMREAFQVANCPPSAMRRNILLEGIDLNALVGKTFTLQGVEFAGTEPCKPCSWMNTAVAEGAFDWLKGQGGLRCRITRGGILSRGTCALEVAGET